MKAMKMIRNISGYAKVLAGAFLAALLGVSCSRLELDVPYVKPGDEHAVKVTFTLGHSEALLDEENQDTKSYLTKTGIDTYISGVTLAVYETGGTQAYLGYVTSGFNAVDITLLNNKTYNIYAVANMGDQRTALSSAIEGGTLSSLTYTVDYSTMNTNGIPMAASVTGQSFSSASSLTVYLQRLLAKINVSLSCDWSEAVITSAKVKNVNPKVAPFGEIPASSTNHAILQDIHGSTPGTGNTMSAVFYVPENNKGTVGSVASSMQKTYTNADLSGVRDYATYLEVDVTTTGEYDGNIVYRSYLGSNKTTDFNIVRNEVYNWTITYSKGNLETYDWKRDTDGLYRYELVCITENPYVDANSGYPTYVVLEYKIRQYSARTGALISSFYPDAINSASYYDSADGNDVSTKLTTGAIGAYFVRPHIGSKDAGPVYVDVTGTYNGHTYHVSSRTLVHVNGIMGWSFDNSTNYLYTFSRYISGLGIYLVGNGSFPYTVQFYNNGVITNSHNLQANNYTYATYTPALPSGYSAYHEYCSAYSTEQGLNTGVYLPPGLKTTLGIKRSSYVNSLLGPYTFEISSTFNQTYYPSGGYRASCTVYIYPYNYSGYIIEPDTASLDAGQSLQFDYLYKTVMNGAETNINNTNSAYTTWSIVSSTGGMDGLSLTNGLFSTTSSAHSGTVVIQAQVNSSPETIATATINVTAGGGTGGGIGDDWEGGGEQVLD